MKGKDFFDGIEGSGWTREWALWLQSLSIDDFVDLMVAARINDPNYLTKEQRKRMHESYLKAKSGEPI